MYYLEILSGLWIGDSEIMNQKKFIEENHIDIVYNCTDIYDFPDSDVTKIRLPFSSAIGEQNISLIQNNHRKITKHIHEHIEHSNIFIGCPDGKCIAPLIVAIYILHYGSLNPKSIYEMLLTKDSSLSLWCDLSLFHLLMYIHSLISNDCIYTFYIINPRDKITFLINDWSLFIISPKSKIILRFNLI